MDAAQVWAVWVMPKWHWWLVGRYGTEWEAMLAARHWAANWYDPGGIRPRTWRAVKVTHGPFSAYRKVPFSTLTIWRRDRANDPNWKGRRGRRAVAG